MNTSTQNKSICLFLSILLLGLFAVQNVEAQWELLLGAEDENWQYQDMKVTEDGGLLLIAKVEDNFRLLRINFLGKVISNQSFDELNLLDTEFINPQIQVLQNSEHLLFYSIDSLETNKRVARFGANGERIWVNNVDYYGEIVEMKSGDYLQITSVEIENASEGEETDVVATAFSRENGSVLWKEVYETEADEEIWKRKWTNEGNYMIAGKSDRHNVFVMNFSDEGEYVGGYIYDFEGEFGDYYFSDLEITQDNGLITTRSYFIESDWYTPFLTLEKVNAEGELEWTRTYDNTDENFEFAFYGISGIANNRIIEALNGNYLLAHNHGYEWDSFPILIEFSPQGEIIWQEHFYYQALIYDEEESVACSYGFEFQKTIPLIDGNYLLSGYVYNTIDAPGVCFTIPTALKINSSGNIDWVDYYDLGNGNGLDISYQNSIGSINKECFLVSEFREFSDESKTLHIIKINENGLQYENLVKGRVYLDSNENCEQEVTENAYENVVINIDSPEITRYAFTDSNGNFSTVLPIGDYTLTYSIDNELFASSCNTDSYQISFTENYDTLSNLNFPLKALVDCPKLEVEIGTPLLRRCFKNTYKVSYCNKGTLAAEDAKISLEFPEEMIPLESSLSALQEGQQWTFDLGTIEVGECGFFTVTDSISCEADLGSTLCLKSRILPDDPCEAPSPLWDRSDIEVVGECMGEHVRFTLKNIGSGNMNEERNVFVYENDVLTETFSIQLNSNERRELYLNPNGRTLRLKVEQSPYFPHFNDQPQSFVEACGEGNFSYGYVNSVEQNDRPPSVDIDCQTIIGSFDPNDIQVFPTGISDQHYIEADTKLTYKIRFQNTGNDTAFRVMIVDTLPQGLEGATLNLGNSSHDYTFDIKFGNLLVWTFDNILLPDSTTNELDSHGFVQYSILPKADIELGTKIENKADIYFDFNAPVATNQVFNTISDDLNTDLGEPLAVDLMDLEAKAIEGNRVRLDWWTLTEVNSAYFEVQRSSNGIDFEGVEKVKAEGNSGGLQHYQFTDFYPKITAENLLYYRLKMVYIDGSDDYSKVVSVRLSGEKWQFRVWAFNGHQTLLDWMGEEEKVYTIAVYNVYGQRALKYKVNKTQTFLPQLYLGVYILQVLDEEGRKVASRKVFVE